jgi:hypothetical protein
MENSTQKSLEILATAVKKADIHVLELVSKLLQVIIYIKNNDDQLSRVLFRSEESDKLHRFNGIIFDSRGEIICYPIKRMINTALCDANKIQEDILKNDYRVYHALNGTVVTCYYYMGSWKLSTSRGIEVDNYKLIGDLTYREIFDELLQLYNLDMTAFEVGKSYSFVIAHPTYHILPFKALVFLGGYDLKAHKFFDDLSAPQLSSIKQSSRPLGKKDTLLMRLNNDSNECMSKFFRTPIKEELSYPKLFGYVLRSKNDGLDYYIESDLMNLLKLGIFSTYRLKIGSRHREVYFIMKIWLYGEHEQFWINILGEVYTNYVREFINLLYQLSIHVYQYRIKEINSHNFSNRVYEDAVIQLATNGIVWETMRNINYLNTYYSVWEEANRYRMNEKIDIEIDGPSITPS